MAKGSNRGGKEMKRYNIHLDPEWMKALDEILQAIKKAEKNTYSIEGITRSDLIRIAIGHYFNLGPGQAHYYWGDLTKIIKKALKKRQIDKGV